MREVTVDELAQHNGTNGSHWISIYGEVWDISEYLPKHPGGRIIRTAIGREGTTLFESYHPGYSLPKIMAALKSNGTFIGKLQGYQKSDDQFFKVVRERVEKALTEKKYGRHFYEWVGVTEVCLSVLAYFVCWYYAVFTLSIIASLLLGACAGRLGFLMHQGLHSAISHYATVNRLVGYCHNLIGSDYLVWSMEHQVAHHTFTNELEKDNDYSIGNPIVRFNHYLEHSRFHRFNHIITFMLMPFGVWRWYVDDLNCIINGRVGSVKFHTDRGDFWSTLAWKAFWGIRNLVIPIYLWGFLWGMVPSVISMTIAAYYMENIFIVNHIQTGLEPKEGSHWAVRQVHTTANWGSGSHFCNMISGGLNHQIEHHLFPSITHYMYPVIHPIVLQTCREYNIPYYTFGSFWDAWYAMYRHLNTLADRKSVV